MLIARLRPAKWQTGNGLFVYSYCCLLANALGYAADIEPVEGFPETFKPIEGERTDADPIEIKDAGSDVFTEEFFATAQRCLGHKVIVYGHMERSAYYLPYRSILRKVLEPALKLPPSNETALHVRGGDSRVHPQFKVDLAYYERALAITGRENAVIYTDDPDWHEYDALGLPVKHGTPLEDFAGLMAARRIIVTKSTFAWWAAFLSSAEMVVQPEPLDTWRSVKTPNAYLRVPDWKQVAVP